MGEKSTIQWTDHTVNFWTGCQKKSDGCKFCYMYRDKERYGKDDPSEVLRVSQSTINKTLKAAQPGDKIFTCSWSDFFNEEADKWRQWAWNIILSRPDLTWQILTKLPERIKQCLPEGGMPANVWIGVSVESEKYLDRISYLEDYLNNVRFVSIEPILSKIKLGSYLLIANWVILGAESGNDIGNYRYRPADLQWFTDLYRECKLAGVPVFIKQLGTYLSKQLGLKDRHGGNIDEFPDHLKIREFPNLQEIYNHE